MRSRTINISRVNRRSLRRGLELYPVTDHMRPRTRDECAGAPRPCPFVSCRHHLYLDVKPNGSIQLNWPHLEPDQLEHSCSLDVADQGGVTQAEVGAALNVTRQRVEQLEHAIVAQLRLAGALEGWR